MKTIVGIRPTGKLHIGHYFSVIKPALETGADVLVAQYHAPNTTVMDTDKLIWQLEKFNLKNIKIQDVNFYQYHKLLFASKMSELERMTQYKSAKVKTPHLLIYPVLMAHDLIGYDKVIVGNDQKQHVEYANKLFRRLGYPEIEGDYRSGRIMSLTDPTKKMSKSEPEGCLFLDDDFDTKLKKAKTDVAGVLNLSHIARLMGLKWNLSENEESKKLLAKKLKEVFK